MRNNLQSLDPAAPLPPHQLSGANKPQAGSGFHMGYHDQLRRLSSRWLLDSFRRRLRLDGSPALAFDMTTG